MYRSAGYELYRTVRSDDGATGRAPFAAPRGLPYHRLNFGQTDMKSNNRAKGRALSGFTLIELMVAVAVVAILAMIAIPNYADYVKRSRIIDGTSKLSDQRVRMEQYFLDNRTYAAGGACGVPVAATASDAFTLTCEATANTYLVKAKGVASKGMDKFEYWINQAGTKMTKGLPTDWSMPDTTANSCWITRKDGSCG